MAVYTLYGGAVEIHREDRHMHARTIMLGASPMSTPAAIEAQQGPAASPNMVRAAATAYIETCREAAKHGLGEIVHHMGITSAFIAADAPALTLDQADELAMRVVLADNPKVALIDGLRALGIVVTEDTQPAAPAPHAFRHLADLMHIEERWHARCETAVRTLREETETDANTAAATTERLS